MIWKGLVVSMWKDCLSCLQLVTLNCFWQDVDVLCDWDLQFHQHILVTRTMKYDIWAGYRLRSSQILLIFIGNFGVGRCRYRICHFQFHVSQGLMIHKFIQTFLVFHKWWQVRWWSTKFRGLAGSWCLRGVHVKWWDEDVIVGIEFFRFRPVWWRVMFKIRLTFCHFVWFCYILWRRGTWIVTELWLSRISGLQDAASTFWSVSTIL